MISQGTVLLVMLPKDRNGLYEALANAGADILTATSCAEASEVLEKSSHISAIFGAYRLIDGNFTDLVRMGRRYSKYIPTVVCMPSVDGGWTDILEAGAFQVIVEPYETQEIQRLLTQLTHVVI